MAVYKVVLSFTYVIGGVEKAEQAKKKALTLLRQKEIQDDEPVISVEELELPL